MRGLEKYISERAAAKKVIRKLISQINLNRHVDARLKFKEIFRRVIRANRIRKAVNDVIAKRKAAK